MLWGSASRLDIQGLSAFRYAWYCSRAGSCAPACRICMCKEQGPPQHCRACRAETLSQSRHEIRPERFKAECRDLLTAIVVLGLVSAVAFSASYQLVSRFANKVCC